MPGPLAIAGVGLGLGALGSILGGGESYGDIYRRQLQGIPGFEGYGDFSPVGLPQLANFERFGSGDLEEAYRMLRPQQQLALANNRRALSAANTASGAGVAAGQLSPAAAAALASRNALNAGMQRTGLETGFAGAGIDLAMQASQQRLAQAQALQGARFGFFDRAFQQEQFGSEFERQQAIDEFMAELQRRGLAGELAGQEQGGQGGSIWDFLSGFGTSLAGAGAEGLASQWMAGQQPQTPYGQTGGGGYGLYGLDWFGG